MIVIRYSLTEIRFQGILLYKFRPFQDIIMTQVGHTGLFCNPKILLNSFMFWDFKASSPFLYCPVSVNLNFGYIRVLGNCPSIGQIRTVQRLFKTIELRNLEQFRQVIFKQLGGYGVISHFNRPFATVLSNYTGHIKSRFVISQKRLIPKKYSPGWTRTSNPSINSRMLRH